VKDAHIKRLEEQVSELQREKLEGEVALLNEQQRASAVKAYSSKAMDLMSAQRPKNLQKEKQEQITVEVTLEYHDLGGGKGRWRGLLRHQATTIATGEGALCAHVRRILADQVLRIATPRLEGQSSDSAPETGSRRESFIEVDNEDLERLQNLDISNQTLFGASASLPKGPDNARKAQMLGALVLNPSRQQASKKDAKAKALHQRRDAANVGLPVKERPPTPDVEGDSHIDDMAPWHAAGHASSDAAIDSWVAPLSLDTETLPQHQTTDAPKRLRGNSRRGRKEPFEPQPLSPAIRSEAAVWSDTPLE